jgi:hypothetical protein
MLRFLKKYLLVLCLSIVSTSGIAQLKKTSFIYSKQYIPFKLVIGELKGMRGVYDAYTRILEQQDKSFPYNLVLEKEASFCFFMNLYISNIDTNVFKYLNFTNKEEKQFFRNIHKLNTDRTAQSKIKLVSFDIEHRKKFKYSLNAVYYMIEKVSNQHYQHLADSIYNDSTKSNHVKTKELISLIENTRLANLMTYDSTLNIIKENLYTSVNLGEQYTKTWYKGREKILATLFIKSTSKLERYCAIVDAKHLPKAKRSFLRKIESEKMGIASVYPIYFNRYTNTELKKHYYCSHPTNPFKYNKTQAKEFSKKQGSWFMSNKDTYYLIVSN